MAKRKVFSLNKNLQEGLSQTMNAVKQYAGELRFEVIPLQQIQFDPDNPRDLAVDFNDLPQGPSRTDEFYERKMAEIERLNSLAETISTQGLINPVVVYKHGNVYRLVAGERRCLASKIAGKADIKANILNEKPTEYRQRVMQWIENIEREDLSLWERIHNIKMIIGAYKKQTDGDEAITASLLKNILGCSTPHASNYLAVINASDEVLNEVETNNIKNLEKAAFIAKASTKTIQRQLIDACVSGASLKQLKQIFEKDQQAQKERKKQALSAKLAAGRGRKIERINLGSVKNPLIIKALIESVIDQDRYRHYHSRFVNLDLKDFNSLSLAFKELLEIIQLVESH